MSTCADIAAFSGNDEAFNTWAAVYDQQDNPLLTLEERYLSNLLPHCAGRHILDVGCGTGRWLKLLLPHQPASMQGVDASIAMLKKAATWRLPNTHLARATLPNLPVSPGSIDLIVASFVMSYVEDFERSATELAHTMRPGADLFLSDMHPRTAAALGWKRGFDAAGSAHQLTSHLRPLSTLIETFTACGLTLITCIEPEFGDPEREIFEARGKRTAWIEASGHPAIYILQFRKEVQPQQPVKDRLVLSGEQCVLGGQELAAASLAISDRIVVSIITPEASAGGSTQVEIDLSEYILFPGLVNAHDHLEFALFPRLGNPPYQNAAEWAVDIQANHAESIACHKRIPENTRLWLGGIRNLLCGVTTVCHHNPLHPALQSEEFPVNVVSNYGWEHSLAFGKNISATIRDTARGAPFFIHACEGVDDASSTELLTLDKLDALEERTVLVHGLAIDDAGIALLNERGAALIICPSSNHFLFQTVPGHERLLSVEQLALGSDSPLTANGDLLDELRFAYHACGLDARKLYGMVTREPARIARLHRGEGSLKVDSRGDCLAIKQRPGSPAQILTRITWRDVELVVVGGVVKLASQDIYVRLPEHTKRELQPMRIDNEIRWLRAPVQDLLLAAEGVLGHGNVRLGGLPITSVQNNDHAN